MSVEIEVGLENAARVKPLPEEQRLPLEEQRKGLANPKLRAIVLIAGAVLIVIFVGLYLYYHNRESTDDAQVDGHITPVSSKIYGRVAEVLVTDNQQVKAGQVLVRIDPRDYQAELDQAKGELALAAADAQSAGVDIPRTRENVASGTSSADAQLLGAEADVQSAQVAYEQSKTSDLAYAQANIDKSRANADATASALKADEQKFAQAGRSIDIAKAQLAAAQARVAQAKAGVSAAHADTRQIGMRTADALGKAGKVQQQRAKVESAQLNLGYTEIVAPVDGVATHKQVEVGQIVQQGQGLMVIVPLQNVWVTANFKETQLRKMKAGQKAEVHVDTYGKTFTGHLDSIAGATGAVLSLLPPENATGNYVKVVQRIPVKIILDPIPPDKAILRPGMNVDATVVTE
jgi:membrane fusion protein (multidrug efflux system)